MRTIDTGFVQKPKANRKATWLAELRAFLSSPEVEAKRAAKKERQRRHAAHQRVYAAQNLHKSALTPAEYALIAEKYGFRKRREISESVKEGRDSNAEKGNLSANHL